MQNNLLERLRRDAILTGMQLFTANPFPAVAMRRAREASHGLIRTSMASETSVALRSTVNTVSIILSIEQKEQV